VSFSPDFRSRNPVREQRLAELTTFRIGGPATVAVLDDRRDLAEAVASGCRWLGKGANLLVGDTGVPQPVLRLGRDFDFIRAAGPRLAVGGGTDLAKLVNHCAAAGLAGPEVLAGVPATVGGALRMNAGTAHGWMLDCVARVEVVLPGGGAPQWIERRDLAAAYRRSGLPEGTWFLGCELELATADPNALLERVRALKKAKADSQPLALPSAGCVFRNPDPQHPAGRLIDQCGLKGARVGGAEVSPVHANFIVNPGRDATAADVVALVRRVRRTVWERTGKPLALEVEAWNCPDELAAHPQDLPC
jgi:UDP-N-acetylmuramate dehydrogenase